MGRMGLRRLTERPFSEGILIQYKNGGRQASLPRGYKRQMYGRAKFDLLKARVLDTP
jgi:hypothetical protein